MLCVQQGMELQRKMDLVDFPATNTTVINLPTSLTHCLPCFQILFHSAFLVFKSQLKNGKKLSKVKISLSKAKKINFRGQYTPAIHIGNKAISPIYEQTITTSPGRWKRIGASELTISCCVRRMLHSISLQKH